MRFEDFELYKLIETVNNYGEVKKEYELVDTIQVYINNEFLEKITDDMLYFKKVIQAISNYNDFNYSDKYKIENENNTYEILALIIGRLTQLQLQEVIQ